MDTATIAGASQLLRTGQNQQAVSISMMKQAAGQQQQMARLLEQSAKQAPQPSRQTEFAFSTYA